MINARTEAHARALAAIPDHRASGEATALQRAADAALVDYASEVVAELQHGFPYAAVNFVIAHASLVRVCWERGDDAGECARIILARGNH